jgi:hypothetical protein
MLIMASKLLTVDQKKGDVALDSNTGLSANANWPLAGSSGVESPFSDDAFSVVDGLDEEERAKIIQDYYEGPKTCQCCINWVDGVPDGHQEENDDSEDEEEGPPIVVRRKRTGGGAKPFAIHAIEIRNAEMRKVLTGVFKGFDGLIPDLKYLTFLAPFRPFSCINPARSRR